MDYMASKSGHFIAWSLARSEHILRWRMKEERRLIEDAEYFEAANMLDDQTGGVRVGDPHGKDLAESQQT